MDDKQKVDQLNRVKADAHDPEEIEYLHQRYTSYSHAEILDAIKTYGPYRADIEKHLMENSKPA